ncbi:MAG: cytochrome c biosis protein transrane region [Firmicutes bacterium]|nr:cytochrome c biosis protein transrane region [Bacillota bacterium]
MDYFITFLEGIITFISPCLMPMLPIYISYFAAQKETDNKYATLINAGGFVLGFTLVFASLGAFAGTAGSFLKEYSTAVNLLAGIIVILFGLNFMELINIPFINTSRQAQTEVLNMNFISAILFGIVFSISWTPCVGAFLGSALMLAATSGESLQGILLLLCFSLGLGIPFMISAILIDNLKSVFDFIKRNYRMINLISGLLLVVVGFMMMTGLWGNWLAILSI